MLFSFSLFVVVDGKVYFPKFPHKFQLIILKWTFHYVIHTVDLMKPIDHTIVSTILLLNILKVGGGKGEPLMLFVKLATNCNVH